MKREIVHIDEELCDGCGICIPSCHEGALQVIDGKARLISDLMCDGLGACLGHCPQGAITIEKREAEPYDEAKVMEIMVQKGQNTVAAHMKHLKDHGEVDFLKEAIGYLNNHITELAFDVGEVIHAVHNHGHDHNHKHAPQHSGIQEPSPCGCPGAREIVPKRVGFQTEGYKMPENQLVSGRSELTQWPVQMHLINPNASYFQSADVVLAADCVAYALGSFHQKYLKGRSLAIACPKLDEGLDVYREKLRRMIDESGINTLTVMIMEVPCCGGLLQLAQEAVAAASRKVPVKTQVVSVRGEILQEEWV